MPNYYQTDIQYLQDELKKLDLLIRLRIARMGQIGQSEDMFRGLYISDEEVSSLLEVADTASEISSNVQFLVEKIRDLEEMIGEKVQSSRENGINLNLPRLREVFSLAEFEFNAVLICAAFEMDTRYERLYAYLQDDLTRKHPSPGLILNLLCDSPGEMIAARQYFFEDRPLIREHILECPGSECPLLSSWIGLSPGVLRHILGSGTAHTGTELPDDLDYERGLSDIPLPNELRSRLKNLLQHLKGSEGRKICSLQGPYGAGKKEIAKYICDDLGVDILHIDLADATADVDRFDYDITSYFRDAIIMGSAVYLDHFELLTREPRLLECREVLLRRIEGLTGTVFIASIDNPDLGLRWQKDLFRIEVPVPGYAARKLIWQASLGDRLDGEACSELANKFRFTAGRIRDAASAAENLAILEGREDPSLDDIYDGCRAQSNQRLIYLARRIKPRYGWEEIILPRDRIDQLKDIKNHIRHRGRVYHDWGFEDKLSLGKGLNALFIGPSGTGKTMAAEVIAHDLGIDLYKIDLSSVISKYIGETEKNLSRVFQEAEESNAMLFFDEADALFGKRSEVRDSHDRYANVEVAYLLQKMEEHEGVVILASNLGSNIDDAFMRRMNFVIEFPFPDEDYRRQIWEAMIPDRAPAASDIDFEFLARKFKISGGSIKNIVINAAFSAAESSSPITMAHMVNSTRKELKKMGKAYSQSDFGKYSNLIDF